MRIKELAESFNQPYKFKWEKSDYGDMDAYTKLPDGTNLSIMFNKDTEADNEYMVEFYRDNSQELTGAGDAQRVFATVISAIMEFLDQVDPERVRFSATKEVEPGQNSQSRSKLYTSLVRRYANSVGYQTEIHDQGSTTVYELNRMY